MDYNKKYFTLNIPYLVNHFIYEYDIAKANLNVLYYKGVIKQDMYDEIIKYGKGEREIYFGNLIRNHPEIGEILSEGLSELRKLFIESNNLTDNDILSVKNDAIFIIDKVPKFTKFDNIEFVKKNVYTSYYMLNKLEMYYFYDPIEQLERIDIKGIKDDKLLLHQDYIITFLCEVFCSIQTGSTEEVLNIIHQFYENYVGRKLEIGFYRELNAESLFRYTFQNGTTYLSTVPPIYNHSGYVNIMNNLNIIRELHSIVNNIKS